MQNNEKYLNTFIRSCLTKDNSNVALQNTNASAILYKELYNSCYESNYFIKDKNSENTTLIAVYGEKEAEFVQILLNIIASGNAYLPIDYLSPPERIVNILKSAKVKSFILDKNNSEKILAYLKSINVKFSVTDYSSKYYCINFSEYKFYTFDLAYVLYTSGSSGVPKGVMHTHESAMAFINWANSTFKFQEKSRFISIAPFSFDISVLDIFATLGCGGTLFIPTFSETGNSRFIAQYLADQRINVIYSTPTFFKSLRLFGKIHNTIYNSVSHVFFAGEQLYYSLVNDVKPCFPKANLFNLYGPTETNVCTYHQISNGVDGPVPIGKACNYSQVHLKETDDGFELWIASVSTMKDYIEKPCEFKKISDEKYYNTGDIVVLDTFGNLVFKNRKDRMIKRNGYRIELGEIENCLNDSKLTDEFLIKVFDDDLGVKIVVEYTSQKRISELELKLYLLLKLPSYMLPDSFILKDSILKNTNFKLT